MPDPDINTKLEPDLPAIPLDQEAVDPEKQRQWRVAHTDALKQLQKDARIDFENIHSNLANKANSADLANTNSNVSNLSSNLANTNANLANTNSNVANLTANLANTNSNVSNLANQVSNLANGYALLEDIKANGTDAGTFTANAWQTRTLTTESVDPNSIVSLASNQFTLAPGTYRIKASAPGYSVTLHQIALYNTNDTTYDKYGTSEAAAATLVVTSRSQLVHQFTLAANKTFELRHRCSVTQTGNGFGRACGFGGNEIYAQVEIWKLN